MLKRKRETIFIVLQTTFFCIALLLSAGTLIEQFVIFGSRVHPLITATYASESIFTILLLINLFRSRKDYSFPTQFGLVGSVILTIRSIIHLSATIPEYIDNAQRFMQNNGASLQRTLSLMPYPSLPVRCLNAILGICVCVMWLKVDDVY